MEKVEGAYFAPGSDAKIPVGLLYQGDYQHESDGTSTAIRLNVRALAAAGLPVLLKSTSGTVLSSKGVYEPLHIAGVTDAVREEIGEFTNTSVSALYPSIRHFVVHKWEDISKRVMRGGVGPLDDPELVVKARQALYSSSVCYSVWERDRIDHATMRELNRMGDNWVPCEQNAEMLRSCGVKNVFVVPHPYAPESPLLKLTRRKPSDKKRFYWIGRWEPRKNPVMILSAFFETFNPGDNVHLTMKWHGAWEGYPSFQEVLRELATTVRWTPEQMASHVTGIEGQLRPDQIIKLHYENNIYLAPSAGEAWCLPAFEAKLSGNRVVYTPYGGTADFCDDSDAALKYYMGTVPRSYSWPPGSLWAEPDYLQFKETLRMITPPLEYKRSPDFEERFSLLSIGNRMRKRLAEKFGDAPKGGYLK